jgi:hypothetical protein
VIIGVKGFVEQAYESVREKARFRREKAKPKERQDRVGVCRLRGVEEGDG